MAALGTSCGSDDDGATVGEPGVSTPSDGSVDAPTENTGDQSSGGGDAAFSEIFSDDEIEDEDDLEDLSLQTLSVPFYFGPTVDVGTIFDSSMFAPVDTIDGVGDKARVEPLPS